MSESVVIGARRPDQDVPEVAVSDMPLLEGAQHELRITPDDKPKIHIPHAGQTVISDRGLPKHGIPVDPEAQAEVKISDLSSKVGSIFHGVARVALAELGQIRDEGSFAINGLRRAKLDKHRERLHGRSPAVYRGWSKRASEMMPEFMETLLPGPGYSAYAVPEARLQVNDDAKVAAAKLKELLEEEQRNGDGTPGPFEKVLLAAPAFQLQARRNGKFKQALKELPEDFPLSRTAIRRLTREARTHMFIKGGNIIAPPTSQPDILEFITEDGDTVAEQASEALANVFKKNIGFDPVRLAHATVTYTERDKTSGKIQEASIPALDAVHWAVNLIAADRITPCVIDIKLQPHVEHSFGVSKWQTMNNIWQDEKNVLSKIFSKENLDSENAKYSDLQTHWNDMERDVAATTYSVLSFFRMAEREFRNLNPREREPLVRWEKLAKRMRASILLVDFDISKPGLPLEHTEAELPLGYQTSPPLEQVGVPKDVAVMLKPIEPWRLEKRLQGREREMRRQYIKHKLGQVATQAAIGQAA